MALIDPHAYDAYDAGGQDVEREAVFFAVLRERVRPADVPVPQAQADELISAWLDEAEEEGARILDRARADAAEVFAEMRALADRRVAAAEQEAAWIRAQAEADAAATRRRAEAEVRALLDGPPRRLALIEGEGRADAISVAAPRPRSLLRLLRRR